MKSASSFFFNNKFWDREYLIPLLKSQNKKRARIGFLTLESQACQVIIYYSPPDNFDIYRIRRLFCSTQRKISTTWGTGLAVPIGKPERNVTSSISAYRSRSVLFVGTSVTSHVTLIEISEEVAALVAPQRPRRLFLRIEMDILRGRQASNVGKEMSGEDQRKRNVLSIYFVMFHSKLMQFNTCMISFS